MVPIALSGTENLLPRGKRIPRLATITLTFGAPLDFSRYKGMEGSPMIRRAVTDEVMYAIMTISGLEYVDSYHEVPNRTAA